MSSTHELLKGPWEGVHRRFTEALKTNGRVNIIIWIPGLREEATKASFTSESGFRKHMKRLASKQIIYIWDFDQSESVCGPPL